MRYYSHQPVETGYIQPETNTGRIDTGELRDMYNQEWPATDEYGGAQPEQFYHTQALDAVRPQSPAAPFATKGWQNIAAGTASLRQHDPSLYNEQGYPVTEHQTGYEAAPAAPADMEPTRYWSYARSTIQAKIDELTARSADPATQEVSIFPAVPTEGTPATTETGRHHYTGPSTAQSPEQALREGAREQIRQVFAEMDTAAATYPTVPAYETTAYAPQPFVGWHPGKHDDLRRPDVPRSKEDITFIVEPPAVGRVDVNEALLRAREQDAGDNAAQLAAKHRAEDIKRHVAYERVTTRIMNAARGLIGLGSAVTFAVSAKSSGFFDAAMALARKSL